MSSMNIPLIDPDVKHIGVSKLRQFNATNLRGTSDTYVIQENDTPLAVLVSFEKFLIMQEQLMSVLGTMELLTDKTDLDGVKAGLAAFKEGRTRSLVEIRAELKKRG